jgi:hypothetical protein
MPEKEDDIIQPIEEKAKKNKKEKIPGVIEILEDKLREIDELDSFGIIILKNGSSVQIRKLLQSYFDIWLMFKEFSMIPDPVKRAKKMEIINGGIAYNGEIAIDVSMISTIVFLSEIKTNNRMRKRGYPNSMDDVGDILEE